MKELSRSKLLNRYKCIHNYQIGNSYCPVGAVMAEYLGRDNLGIIQEDCYFDCPEDVMSLLMLIAQCNSEGLKKYSVSSETFLTDGWINTLGALLWDMERQGLIKVVN